MPAGSPSAMCSRCRNRPYQDPDEYLDHDYSMNY